jgi:TPR repeat protein
VLRPKIDPIARADAAQLEYGHYLMEGERVEVDREDGARYFKQSADQGNSDGQNNCGRCFE